MVDVRLINHHQISTQIIPAVMDSGSSINLFHSYFGQQIGINVNKGKLVKINGIGNIVINTYVHDLTLMVGKFKIITQVHFSDNQRYYQIIGTCTFQQFNRIIFHEAKKILILEK